MRNKQSDRTERELLATLPELSEAEMDRLTREGLADVDAGRTIPHEVVVRWVNEVLLAGGARLMLTPASKADEWTRSLQ